MGHRISLFSGYNLSENRTTNYCLLILKMLYEENPNYLADFLSMLGGEDFGENVGVKFYQQKRKKNSIPDGVIIQKSFGIYIETKNFNWFYDNQLERHLESLGTEDISEKILLALCNFEKDNYNEQFSSLKNLCKTKFKNRIKFEAISFNDFVDCLDKLSILSNNLKDNIEDFKLYLNEQNLLPGWKNWLDVVNCARIPEEIIDGNVYLCPATSGSYNHGRCMYFGMYRNKKVEKISTINGIVDIISDNEVILLWNNSNKSNASIKKQALKKLNEWRPNNYPTRVFVLGNLFTTEFIKDSRGGMMCSKQYFNISRLAPTDTKDLAEKLKGKLWSEFQ